jgi:hypothetical protein
MSKTTLKDTEIKEKNKHQSAKPPLLIFKNTSLF